MRKDVEGDLPADREDQPVVRELFLEHGDEGAADVRRAVVVLER